MSDETTQNEPEKEPVPGEDEGVEDAKNAALTPRQLTEHHVGALREWLESPLEYPRTSDPWAERADDFMSRNFSDDAAAPLDFPRPGAEHGDVQEQLAQAEPVYRYDGETGALLAGDAEEGVEVPEHPRRRVEDFENWFDEPEPISSSGLRTEIDSPFQQDPWFPAEVEEEGKLNSEPTEAEDLPSYPQDGPHQGIYESATDLGQSETETATFEGPKDEQDGRSSPQDGAPFGFVDAAPYEPPFVPVAYVPEAAEETGRRSGLALSSGIAFFGSVAFMLFLGWLADLLLGSSPWGIVGGIVLGSIIGFIQFFRISSRIFKNGEPVKEYRPILSDSDPE